MENSEEKFMLTLGLKGLKRCVYSKTCLFASSCLITLKNVLYNLIVNILVKNIC